MNLIKRALVALDLSEMDDQLLSYTKLFSEILDLNSIHFIHVIPNYYFQESSEIAAVELAPIAMKIDQRVKNIIQQKVNQQFSDKEKEMSLLIDVLEGMPHNKILDWTNDKKIDLLITGRKKISDGSGLTARRVAQKANCHVLFVPEKTNKTPSKILVPIDFSKNSAHALKAALDFKKILPEVEITAANVIQMLPSDYYVGFYQNPLYRETFFVKAKKDYAAFIDQYDIPKEDFDMVYLENKTYNAIRQLNDYAHKKDSDLVIMGAKGHSLFENFLYGSVTERLVETCSDIPILVVR